MTSSRMSLRARAGRKASDERICDFETPLEIDDNREKRKRASKIVVKDSKSATDFTTLRPQRNRKALVDDIYDYDKLWKSDIDDEDDDDVYNGGKRQKSKEQNNIKTEEPLSTTFAKETTPIPATIITSVTKQAGEQQTKPAPAANAVLVTTTRYMPFAGLIPVTTKTSKKRMKKYNYFDKMSDELILEVFKWIAKPHVKGPLGTFFENVYQLCRFRYISVRMSEILSINVICMTLLNSSKINLLKQIRAENLKMGNCCLSTCKDVYRLYEKDLIRHEPLLKRNPHYRSAAPMKLYSRFLAVKLCLKKYGSYEKLNYYQEKKRENRINKVVARPSHSHSIKNDDDDIIFQDDDEFEDTDDNIPIASNPVFSHRPRLIVRQEKNLHCDICADNRLFTEDGLRQHTSAKHGTPSVRLVSSSSSLGVIDPQLRIPSVNRPFSSVQCSLI